MKLEIFQKSDRTRVDLIRTYDFVQYVDNFNGVGTFRMSIPYTEKSLPYLVRGNYILFEDGIMGIIKYRKKKTSESTTLELKGYLLNEILGYRCFLRSHQYKDEITKVVRAMVSELFITSDDARRNVDFIVLATDEQYIPSSPSVSVQKTGDKLNVAVADLLQTIGYGYDLFPLVAKYDEKADKPTNISAFEFRVRKPVDRTIDNADGNNPVVFSIELNNVTQLEYTEDSTAYCSIAVVAGEGTGMQRIIVEAGDSEASGLDRIELYVDARDLQSERYDGTTISADEYNEMLVHRGNERLQEHVAFTTFDGTIRQGSLSYRYGVDFFKGDYVSLIDRELNIVVSAQITAVTKSITKTGEIFDVTFGYERSTLKQLVTKRGVI